MNKNWLPFLRAGLAFRGGNLANFEKWISEAQESQKTSPFVGDMMTFAALQQMNIPGPDLKVFRNKVEESLENASKLALSDLFAIGSFFWDLTRTGLKYKGYRTQSSKAGKAFANNLKSITDENLSPVQIDAFSWGAHHKFWASGNDPQPSPALMHRALREPRLAAAVLNWLLRLARFPHYEMQNYVPLIAIAKEATRTEKDAFYRFYFEKVSDGVSAIHQEMLAIEERHKSYDSQFDEDEFEDDDFEDEFGEFDDEDEDDFLDGEVDLDEELCDCPECQANRVSSGKIFEATLKNQPKAMLDVFAKLGPSGTEKFIRLVAEKKQPEEFVKAISRLFPNYGISPNEIVEFVMAIQEVQRSSDEDFSTGPNATSSSDLQSAEQLKAARKRREKELERKKREASRSRR